MIMNEKVYFDFLQLAIDSNTPLPISISSADWQRLFDFCRRQALAGVGFSAVERLHRQGIGCPASLKMKWMALALQIERQNEILNNQCKELAERLGHDGLSCCILKGQGNLLNYPEHLKLRRNPGDIDVWCVAPEDGLPIAVLMGKDRAEYVTYHGRRAVREYVMTQHKLAGNDLLHRLDEKGLQHRLDGKEKTPVIRYHHIEAPDMDGTPIEVHFRVGHINSPLRNCRMQRWFDNQADVCMKNKTLMGFAVPTASVNVVYQMTHLFTHYFDEGLGLRQLMDYYFALKTWHNDVVERRELQSQGLLADGLGAPVMSREEVMRVLRSFGMGRFAAAVMWVLKEVFAMPTHYFICDPNEKEGRKLLDEIMQGGNFGQYDERGRGMKNGGMMKHGVWKLRRVMRLVGSYPEEALWEPGFRVYHLMWRFAH